MTQFDTDDDQTDDGGDQGGNPQLRAELKRIKAELKETQATADANAGAAKRLAFQDAGLPDTPATRFYLDHYSGPLDPDSIKADAATNGFLEVPNTDAEVETFTGIAAAANGAEASDTPGSQAAHEAKIDELAAGPDGSKKVAAYLQSIGRVTS